MIFLIENNYFDKNFITICYDYRDVVIESFKTHKILKYQKRISFESKQKFSFKIIIVGDPTKIRTFRACYKLVLQFVTLNILIPRVSPQPMPKALALSETIVPRIVDWLCQPRTPIEPSKTGIGEPRNEFID